MVPLEQGKVNGNDEGRPPAQGLERQGSTLWTSNNKTKHMTKEFNRALSLAPVTPRPKDLVILTVLLSVPVFLFVVAFSGMGYGIATYRFLSKNADFGSAGLGIAAFIAFCMYLLDCEYWDGPYDRAFWSNETLQKIKPLNNLRRAAILTATVFFVMGIIFRIEQYNYGPLCVFLVLLVGYIITMRLVVFGGCMGRQDMDVRQYVGSLTLPLLVTGSWLFAWWVTWTNQYEKGTGGYRIWSPSIKPEYVGWSVATKLHYAERMGCEAEYAADEKVTDPYPSCLGAFLIWSTPATIAFALAIFALTAYVLDPNDTHGAPKMIGQFILILLFGMWCSASISGKAQLFALGAAVTPAAPPPSSACAGRERPIPAPPRPYPPLPLPHR